MQVLSENSHYTDYGYETEIDGEQMCFVSPEEAYEYEEANKNGKHSS